jgi:hypothetical protein
MTKIILAGSKMETLTRAAHPPFAAAGFDVAAVVDVAEELANAVALVPGALVVVEAQMYGSPEEAATQLAGLAPTGVVVVLPRAWEEKRRLFARMPNLVEGHTEPVTWAQVAASAKGKVGGGSRLPVSKEQSVDDTPATTEQAPAATRIIRRKRKPIVRLGFYGARGGVGVSTTALSAAQALAQEKGQRVGLFDATGRGDLHVMLGLRPTREPVSHERITLFSTAPDEETAQRFDAVIVDGGRVWGNFNAQWIEVDKPFPEERIRRLVGLSPRKEEQDALPGRERQKRPRRGGLNLGDLLSIEVTE